jgi:hypothetical protein
VSAVKRDAKGRFAPKVKKNVTKERFKKAGLKYKPKKPHAPVLRKKKKTPAKDTTHLKRYWGEPTNADRHGKPKWVPNVRSDPFRTVPRINPETRTKLDPNAILEEVRQSLETELSADVGMAKSNVSAKVVSVHNHGDYLYHEYTFVFDSVAVGLDSLQSYYEIARPFLRPHYRSNTNLVALVGFEHEERAQMEIGPRSLAATMIFDHAFMEIPKAVNRWSTSTNYKAICGIEIQVKAPDWMQPKDKQQFSHAPAKRVKHDKRKDVAVTKKAKGSSPTARKRAKPATHKQARRGVKSHGSVRKSAKGHSRGTIKAHSKVGKR